ncbi:MAG TPA: hypothetical protein VFA84_02765 [Acidimicrobiales bacterium]|nr:hypothetical protein [Acidimicrobiales bacterium]
MAAAVKGGGANRWFLRSVVLLLGALLAGCSTPVSRLFVSRTAAVSTTTTAAPQPASLTVTVTPAEGPAGTVFHLHLTGLAPSDVVTFSIAATGGRPYTGPRHVPGADGSVSAVYETSAADPAGVYVVLAHTATGRGAFASFRVDAFAR